MKHCCATEVPQPSNHILQTVGNLPVWFKGPQQLWHDICWCNHHLFLLLLSFSPSRDVWFLCSRIWLTSVWAGYSTQEYETIYLCTSERNMKSECFSPNMSFVCNEPFTTFTYFLPQCKYKIFGWTGLSYITQRYCCVSFSLQYFNDPFSVSVKIGQRDHQRSHRVSGTKILYQEHLYSGEEDPPDCHPLSVDKHTHTFPFCLGFPELLCSCILLLCAMNFL